MERKVLIPAIITVMTGFLLTTGSPVFSLEKSPAGAEQPDDAKGIEKVVEKPAGKSSTDGQATPANMEDNWKKEKQLSDNTIPVSVKFPFFSPLFTDVPVASVADETIYIRELRDAVASVHENMKKEQETDTKKSFLDILQRLINAKLVVLEARNIELDKLPEIRSEVEKNAEMQLRQELFLNHLKGLKADEKEVEKIYREMIKEWKLESVYLKDQNDANAFKGELKSGKSFDDLKAMALKEGKAEQMGQNEAPYMNAVSLGPQIVDAISGLKVGDASQIIPTQKLFMILMVQDIKYVENPEMKEKALSHVMSNMRLESLNNYKKELYKEKVKEQTKLIKSIDFEATKPGLANMLKDKRVIVSVRGEKPITVAELAQAVKEKYYHGVDIAIKEKRVNREKLPILDELVSKRVFKRAALEKGLDKSPEYRNKLVKYEESLLFGTFIEKVVKPDITITQDEMKTYYEDHKSEYVFPQMLQLNDIVFKSRNDAQSAIDKLRKGMDFKWLKINADGQVAKDSKGILEFGGQMLSVKSFPEDLQKVLNGAHSGDYRLYESPEGYNYVLTIVKDVPSRTQTLDEVKNDVAEKVRWQNFNKAIEEWFRKLREAYPVKIYLQQQ